jgi:spermidine synthase
VIPWEHLDTAAVPGDGGELRLMRRGAEYSIMAGPIELMNSRLSGSEEALATLAHERIGGRPKARVLIGGLGMGFTLRAALGVFGADAGIVVSEIVPAVIAWARGPLAVLHGDSLDDPRVAVREGDVAGLIAEGGWDGILLDVDN